ncbi:histidine kinase [Fructobacillus pseudoficulneus]|uniref:Histidine kinase n=1 Tax=Fructobacillus pseudoficulneus TaxID=220714 RepID=A0A3F3H9M0_9LACO|nr:hypothetical protein [Fructobacillus pseudoficulneus]GAP03179.1 histidine kinase [Fructobacillus pseudoficulneus]SEH40810.1 hypothetical protein SAMN05660469_0769 [Fructobacillus pseudoficulneus]
MSWLYNFVILFIFVWITFVPVRRIQKIQKQSSRRKLALAFGGSYIVVGLIITAVSSLKGQDWYTFGGFLIGAGAVMIFQTRSKQ